MFEIFIRMRELMYLIVAASIVIFFRLWLKRFFPLNKMQTTFLFIEAHIKLLTLQSKARKFANESPSLTTI